MSDTDDPEAFVRDFVDKDRAVTFHISKSGDDSVYGAEPFRFDWLVYSNDKEPTFCTPSHAQRDCVQAGTCEGHTTRTFEGYLRERGKEWEAFDKHGRTVPGSYNQQEHAAFAIHRANKARVINQHKAKGMRRVESIVDQLLEAVPPDDAKAVQRKFRKMFTPGSKWTRINYRFPTRLVGQGGQIEVIPAGDPVQVTVIKPLVDSIVFNLQGQSSYLTYPDPQRIKATFAYPAGVHLDDARGTILSYRPV